MALHNDTLPDDEHRRVSAADDDMVTQVMGEIRQARRQVLRRFARLRELGIEWSDPEASSDRPKPEQLPDARQDSNRRPVE